MSQVTPSDGPSFDSRVKAVQWRAGCCRLLDQRLLPAKVVYQDYDNAAGLAAAIRDMVVRGAPAIGIAAAYGVVLAARAAYRHAGADWRQAINADLQSLAAARPTAINLCWALQIMQDGFAELAADTDPEAQLLKKARQIHEQDIAANLTMARLGAEQLGKVRSVITHCNAGALATGGYGTALGVIRAACSSGNLQRVYAGETRPWLQGARLTAWELAQDAIPVTLFTDNAASYVLSQGDVDWVIVGADRIAANGDVANKIGTCQLAICARHHSVRFMVVAPLSTIDLRSSSGQQIPIEQRPEDEVLQFSGTAISAEGVTAVNPAFDITPADLIDVIVTEKAVVQKPDQAKIQSLFN